MKRFLIRLGIISVVAVLGLIAIAQANRGPAAASDEVEAGAAGGATTTPAESSAADLKAKPDPFTGSRLQAAPTQSPAAGTMTGGASLFDAPRNAPLAGDNRALTAGPTGARPSDSASPASNDRYQRPRAAPPAFGADRYGDATPSAISGPSAAASSNDSYGAAASANDRPSSDAQQPADDRRGSDQRDAPPSDSRYGDPRGNSARLSAPAPQFDTQSSAGNDAAAAATPPTDNVLRPQQVTGRIDRYNGPSANDLRSQEPAGFTSDATTPPRQIPAAAGSPFDNLDRRTAVRSAVGLPIAGQLSPDEGNGRPGAQQLEGTQSPALSIEKFAPAEIQIGKPATFEIVVRNVGKVRAQSVAIHDQVPKKTRLMGTTPPAERSADGQIVWNLGALEPGAEQTVKLELMPTDEGEIGSVATVHFAAQSSIRTVATRPELQIDVTAPKQVMIGGNATLLIKISNPGTGPATGVMIKEMVPDAFTHPAGPELEYEVGELKPGEVRELELVLTAAKAGPTANLLTARGDGTLQARQQTEMQVIAPALEVKLVGPKRRFLDREATYTVSVSNPGTASARDVELVTYLPKGMEFVKADNYGEHDPQARAVRWSLEELPAGETGTVTLTAMPVEAGDYKLLIEGTANQGLSAKQEQAIVVEGVAAILFQVVDVADPIEVGGETTYEIRVVNQGSKAATDVQLQAQLPPQMKAIAAEGPTRHVIEGGAVYFDKLPRLAPKADTTYRIRVQGLQAGDLRMKVQVVTNEITQPVVKEESTRVYADE